MRIVAPLALLLCVPAAAFADLKVTQKAGAAGHSAQSTVYIKGARERTETPGMTTIRQCDLKRVIHVNERTRTYFVAPLDEGGGAPAEAQAPAPKTPQRPARRGAVVTQTVTLNDTGERKQMFGHTARRIKTTTVMDAPEGSCNPGRMEMESDGWYIDLAAGLSCDAGRAAAPMPPVGGSPDCQDEIRFKQAGAGKLGFPVMVTTKMKVAGMGEDEEEEGEEAAEAMAMMAGAMTSTIEVTDISTVTLDPALFDIPAGYKQASSMQELYGSSPVSSVRRAAGGVPVRRVSFPGRPARKRTAARVPSV